VLPFLILAAAAAAPAKTAPPVDRGTACARLALSDAARAIAEANAWRLAGGGVAARQCLGMAYVQDERWLSAATAFEEGARDAQNAKDPRAAVLWSQAGNAALAGGDPTRARAALDSALIAGTLSDPLRGEAELDRARADVALNDPAAARIDLDHALQHVPDDPMAWLLSATLARRQGEVDRATADIAEAVKRAPDDPDVALEEGNVQAVAGDLAKARLAWQRAVKTGANLPSGKSAATALQANADIDADDNGLSSDQPAQRTPAAPPQPAAAPAPTTQPR
jgi:tetratricopeptide (TPR) repeat protein